MGEVEARPRRGPQRPVRQEASSTNISPREEAEKVCHQAPHYLSHQLHQEARRGAQKNPQLSDVGDQGQDQGTSVNTPQGGEFKTSAAYIKCKHGGHTLQGHGGQTPQGQESLLHHSTGWTRDTVDPEPSPPSTK